LETATSETFTVPDVALPRRLKTPGGTTVETTRVLPAGNEALENSAGLVETTPLAVYRTVALPIRQVPTSQVTLITRIRRSAGTRIALLFNFENRTDEGPNPGPVTPVVPVGPVGPIGPVDPVEPVAPVVPDVPVLPVAPVAPVGPVAPVPPVLPVAPVAPVEPVAPVSPVEPVAPVSPVAPV
jgi:hypothetical protein